MQESIAFYFVNQFLPLSFELREHNLAHIRGVDFALFGVNRRKGSEVMFPDNGYGGSLDCLFLQRVRMVIDISGQFRRTDFAPPNAVAINLALRAVAGVECRRSLLCREHADG